MEHSSDSVILNVHINKKAARSNRQDSTDKNRLLLNEFTQRLASYRRTSYETFELWNLIHKEELGL